jgi:hypothetical protein
MNASVLQTFLSASSARRAQLAGNVRTFVNNDGFANLFSALDVNDTNPKNKTRASNIYFIANMAAAYNSVPGLADQVRSWLSQP